MAGRRSRSARSTIRRVLIGDGYKYRRNNQRTHALAFHFGKCIIKFAKAPYYKGLDLQPEFLSDILRFFDKESGSWIGTVSEKRHATQLRQHLAQQLEPLSSELRSHER